MKGEKSLLMNTLKPVLGMAAGLLVVWTLAAAPGAEIIEQVLVKVNGEIFTKTDLEARQVLALRQMQNERSGNLTDAQLRQMLDEATPQLIVSVVDEMIILQRGRDLGYRMTDEQFQGVLDSIKKDNKIETDEQFQAALKEENMTLADLRKSIERQSIITRVQQNEILGKVSVSEEEAHEYYDAHLDEFTSPQTITLREILVNAAQGQEAAAQEKAASIRARALAGESFEKLAADLSDSPSRSNAGLVGPLSVNDISPDLQKLLATMKPGDITELLRSSRGFQILKLESKSTAETESFDKAREQISNRVFTMKRQQEFQKYLEKLRSEAIIEWKNEDLKKAYDQGVSQSKAAAENQTGR